MSESEEMKCPKCRGLCEADLEERVISCMDCGYVLGELSTDAINDLKRQLKKYD